MFIVVSSEPKELVATHVNSAESVRSVLLMLRSDSTPFAKISSLIVYLLSLLGSSLFLFMFHIIPMGFSPLASHCKTVGSPLLDV